MTHRLRPGSIQKQRTDQNRHDLHFSSTSKIIRCRLRRLGDAVGKRPAVDLLNIPDPDGISLPAPAGDVGLGSRFAFPFTTIEDVFVIDNRHIGVLNDNNFPFRIGRHVGTGKPDDNEFIIIRLYQPLLLAQ